MKNQKEKVLANKKKEKDGEHLAAVTNDFLFLFLLEIVSLVWPNQIKKEKRPNDVDSRFSFWESDRLIASLSTLQELHQPWFAEPNSAVEFQVCLANEEESRDKRLSPLPIKSFLFVIGGLKPTWNKIWLVQSLVSKFY